ncbi:sigma 54-interacting transcriptional regulator [Teredinibacter purpureus]|uniref:sigma 54-interacting transcriptional regulator n=1 Tax=Teredinibacter purpureus TaxID=2731756 RepID=UPI000696FC50|nr:sigma-54 dependent transcriptional regulator [Teredinibacter purpureus]
MKHIQFIFPVKLKEPSAATKNLTLKAISERLSEDYICHLPLSNQEEGPQFETRNTVFIVVFSSIRILQQVDICAYVTALRQRGPSLILALFECPLPDNIPRPVCEFDDIIFEYSCATDAAEQTAKKIFQFSRKQSGKLSDNDIQSFFKLNFVGKSESYYRIINRVIRVSHCDAAAHIFGESGTGKEMVARALHYFGNRRDNAFVPINCAAIPDALFESELFGYEKGAFTGANASHAGLVSLADRGTLFLDEVDSLSEKAQSALLRFLQTGEYRPVGSNKIRHADTRIISATNTPLAKKVMQQHFREDLMFRLNVLDITIPPLRERVEDIAVIAKHLMSRFSRIHNRGKKILHCDYLAWLETQSWQGNVRELENHLLRDYLLREESLINNQQLDAPESPASAMHEVANSELQNLTYQQAKEVVINNFTKRYLKSILSEAEGNVTYAAILAGKERRSLGKMMKKYGIDRTEYTL